MSVTFAPLKDGILLALEPEQEVSSIIQVQRFTEGLARMGKVTAVGPEVREIKVGQVVLASITGGVELAGGVLITEKAVLGIRHDG